MPPSSYRKASLAGAVLLLLVSRAATAQDTPEPWVTAFEAPQYFAVSVADPDRSVAWYQAAFGLRQLDDQRADDGAWRIVNLANDHLFVEIIRDNRAHEAERPRGFFKVGFRVPDVDEVVDRVAQTTGERPRVIEFERHGIRLLQLRDPDGNILQLSSPLGNEAP